MVLSMGKRMNSLAVFPTHMADDFNYAKKVRRQELEEHWKKVQEKPFSQKVRL